MSDLPIPMTPMDSDLRGMEWMPLFGARLFTSSFAAHAADAVFRAALRLWWAAWLQVPSASLPDDDLELCELAGLGRDRKAWAKMRAADVLHGFVKCADGRLYHPVLAPQAKVAWEKRVKERERKRDYRGHHPPTNGSGTYVPRDNPRDNPRDVPRTDHGTSAARPVQTGTGTVKDSSFLKKGEEAARAYAPAREEAPSEAAVRAARQQSAAEVSAMPAAMAEAVRSASAAMRNYALDGQRARQTINEQREDVATRTPPRPAYLSREQLQAARRQQLRVVA